MRRNKWLRGRGIEIGAHDLPIEGIRPIYVDRFFEFAHAKCLVDAISDASILPFKDDSLDYIASSHLLEHLANPIRALVEWNRIVRAGGIVYLVVPDRRFTFDRFRERTPLSHLISDFERATTDCDPTHIDDFVTRADFQQMRPDLRSADIPRAREEYRRSCENDIRAGRPINIHFHVFEKEDVVDLMEYLKHYEKTKLDWTIVETEERFPPHRKDGFLIVIRVRKAPSSRWNFLGRQR
ncbi:MAG: class I SAM-dependent methyltransferase [Candidatus Abyssobacteria bacterium SURF_5]|uniref:Class I SAM-dependent methyltransferase n=1 Tax=Abyssobacteria bacterium (strain SURF_5) TaxID=2093360 RepID=A0A3A4NPJ7_ABYX5|nr:MAG: class I SAM-dependent methyltransferase [Candidatus Abyssubacteria bacterium SURF_5]